MCELRKRVGDAEQLHCEAEDDRKKKKKLTLTSVTKLENQNKTNVLSMSSHFLLYIIIIKIQSNPIHIGN